MRSGFECNMLPSTSYRYIMICYDIISYTSFHIISYMRLYASHKILITAMPHSSCIRKVSLDVSYLIALTAVQSTSTAGVGICFFVISQRGATAPFTAANSVRRSRTPYHTYYSSTFDHVTSHTRQNDTLLYEVLLYFT